VRFSFFILLTLLTVSAAFSEPFLKVDVLEGGKARITYEVRDLKDIENLTKTIQDPMVQALIGERVASLFCWDIEDFFIVPEKQRVLINVECAAFAKRSGNTYRVEPKNFTGMKPITITINLPEGAELLQAEPEPSEISGNSLTWRSITSMPLVEYREKGGYAPYLAAAVVAALLALLAFRRLRR